MKISETQMKISETQLGLLLVIGLALAGCGGGSKDIHGAAIDGDLARVKKLVADGEDINKRGKKKVTPLHLAAFQGNTRHIAMAKWLLANGANAGARDHEGKRPSTWRASVDTLRLLTSYGPGARAAVAGN